MKTTLKRKLFDNAISLCNFVNEYKITKENIQGITVFEECYILFYWELSE